MFEEQAKQKLAISNQNFVLCLFLVCYLDIILDRGNGCNTFFRNVLELLEDCAASHRGLRRKNRKSNTDSVSS
jgi:hypothetical protein